jgi:hypothetical protein
MKINFTLHVTCLFLAVLCFFVAWLCTLLSWSTPKMNWIAAWLFFFALSFWTG